MLLSKSCEYGIRAALYLAAQPTGENVPIRSISEELGIPYHFLAKIVQTLVSAGIVSSVRGSSGGIGLAKPASRITLEQVVLALDGPGVFTECVLGLPGCGNRKPCPLHDQWAETRHRLYVMFAGASLEDTAHRIQAGDFRLSALTEAPLA